MKTLGKKPGLDKINEFSQRCSNFKDGKFINTFYYEKDADINLIKDEFKSDRKNRKADKENIPVIKIDKLPSLKEDELAITWLGHSSSIIQMGENTILLDPVLSNNVSPFPFGFKRFYKGIPITADKLPTIDAVIISHNHYDHLDYKTIKAIDEKVIRYFVPLGVESYLEYWGIKKDKIISMNWFDKAKFNDISINCTPSNHFSGRNLFDRNASLWASYVIQNKHHKVFFSGDSGYGSHYKMINSKYGDMDVCLMECGQYNSAWADIHMRPNETFKGAMDLKAKNIIPIHWGAFSLSMHKWNEPPEKMTAYAKNADVNLIIPKVGQSVLLNKDIKQETWWR